MKMAKIQTQQTINAEEQLSDKSFQSKNLDLYYENSHIKCYYLCQKYKDYFKTA